MIKYKGLNKGQTRARLKEIKDHFNGYLIPSEFDWVKGAFEFLIPEHLTAKIGNRELIGISIDKAPTFSDRCYYLHFSNGTKTDISYKGARSGKSNLIWALRNVVMPTIWAFKKSVQFPTRCPITGNIIEWDDADVDHYDMTFQELVSCFIEKKGGVDKLLPFISQSTDNSDVTLITSQDLVNEFIAFHNSHTHLRVVSKEANRSILKKKNAVGSQLNLF